MLTCIVLVTDIELYSYVILLNPVKHDRGNEIVSGNGS